MSDFIPRPHAADEQIPARVAGSDRDIGSGCLGRAILSGGRGEGTHDLGDEDGARPWRRRRGPTKHADTFVQASLGGNMCVLRHFDVTGRLLDERVLNANVADIPVIRPGGGAVWLMVPLDAGGRYPIDLRLEDEDGEETDSLRFESDGTGVMDAIFIGSVLYVLSNDGLTRIAIPPLAPPQ